MSRRHVNVPMKHGVTGEGFAIKSGVKSLRKQFDTWRAKFEAENAALRAQRDDLLAACEALVAGVEDAVLRFLESHELQLRTDMETVLYARVERAREAIRKAGAR